MAKKGLKQTRLTATGRTKSGRSVKKRPTPKTTGAYAGEVETHLRVYRNTRTGKLRTG